MKVCIKINELEMISGRLQTYRCLRFCPAALQDEEKFLDHRWTKYPSATEIPFPTQPSSLECVSFMWNTWNVKTSRPCGQSALSIFSWFYMEVRCQLAPPTDTNSEEELCVRVCVPAPGLMVINIAWLHGLLYELSQVFGLFGENKWGGLWQGLMQPTSSIWTALWKGREFNHLYSSPALLCVDGWPRAAVEGCVLCLIQALGRSLWGCRCVMLPENFL